MKVSKQPNAGRRSGNGAIEVLESRIAPATLVDARTVTYKDLDSGGLVTVKFSKDIFDSVEKANRVLKFSSGSVIGEAEPSAAGQSLQLVNIAALTEGNSNVALGVSISIEEQGDLKADVGAIYAPQIPLGSISIDGDLGRIVVGNAFFKTGLTSLKVGSLGARGLSTQMPDSNPNSISGLEPSLVSTVTGALGSLTVQTDVLDARFQVLDSTVGPGNIGSVNVGGKISGLTQYVQVQGQYTWQNAKLDAEARGGRLAVLNTGPEQTLITTLGFTGWIGLTDRGTEGTFKWVDTMGSQNGTSTFVDGSTLGATTNWNSGEPRVQPTSGNRALTAVAAPLVTFNSGLAAKLEVQSVSEGSDVLVFSGNHDLATGQQVDFLVSGGAATAPGGLVSGGTYFVIVEGTDTVKLASSLQNANDGIALDLQDVGSGGFALQAASAAGVKPETNKITFSAPHGFQTGQVVDYLSRGGLTGVTGLTDLQSYFAVVIDDRTIQLATSVDNATAQNPVVVDIQGSGESASEAFQSGVSVGVKVDSDKITLAADHQLSTGDRVLYKIGTAGVAISGLQDGETYYVIKSDNRSIRFATSRADALAGMAVNLTAAGSGSAQVLEMVDEDAVAVVNGGKWVTRGLTDTAGYVLETQANGAIRADGTIGTVVVGGKIQGGAADASGIVFAQRGLGKVTLGSNIEGGAGATSGVVLSNGAISSVTMSGDLLGGAGTNSGMISGASIGSASVGSVQGGAGAGSGLLQSGSGTTSGLSVQGALKGGTGEASGQVNLAAVKTVSLGSVEGGSGEISGSLRVTGGNLDALTVAGRLTGGGGVSSGVVLVTGALGSVRISGNLEGGGGADSGVVSSGGALGTVVVSGGILGNGAGSGVIKSFQTIRSVSIGASVVGGAGVGSGTIQAGADMGSVTIGGKLKGGSGSGSGSVFAGTLGQGLLGRAEVKLAVIGGTGTNSGSISAVGRIGTLVLGGTQTGSDEEVLGAALVGNAQSSAVNSGMIYAGAGMGSVTVNGRVQGGGASQSGSIVCVGKLDALTVNGSVVGGSGARSGSIFAQDFSEFETEIAGGMGKVVITGALMGGGGAESGRLEAAGSVGSISVQSVSAGAGAESGGIESGTGAFESGNVGSITVTAALTGSTVVVGGRLGTLTVGTLSGATVRVADDLGALNAGGLLNSTVSARGQAAPRSATTDVAIGGVTVTGNVTDSRIQAGHNLAGAASNVNAQIGRVNVGGNWENSDLFTGAEKGNAGALSVKGTVTDSELRVGGSLASFTGGAVSRSVVRAGNDLGSVTVASLLESTISARGQAAPRSVTTDVAIGGVTVTGNVTNSFIQAGHNLAGAAVNGNAQIGRVNVGGNWENSDLVTGADRGNAAAFRVVGSVTDSELRVGGSLASFTGGAVSRSVVRAGNDLGSVTVASLLESTISARGQAAPRSVTTDVAIGGVTVAGNVTNSFIQAGHNLAGAAVNGNAQIGRVNVGGNWENSDLVTGADRGNAAAFRVVGTVTDSELRVGGSLASFTGGAVSGSVVRAGNDLGSVTAASLLNSTISARGQAAPRSTTTDVAIGGLTVTGNVTGSQIQAGHNLAGTASNENAQIGAVNVGGSWLNSDLLTGAARGNAGAFTVKGVMTDAELRVGGSLASLVCGAVSGSVVRAGNDLGSVTVAALLNSTISARGQAAPRSTTTDLAIGGVTVTGNVTDSFLQAGHDLSGVAVNGNAQIVKVSVGGNWVNSDLLTGAERGNAGAFMVKGLVTDAELRVGGSLASFSGGAVSGSVVRAGNDLGSVTVASLLDSTITARGQAVPGARADLAIGKVSVAGNVTNSMILAGYNLAGVAVNADAQVGAVVVGGDWRASSLAAGVVDVDGDGFGDADDRLIGTGGVTALVARIAEVTVRGGVFGTPADPGQDPDPAAVDHYGFVAQQFGKFVVGTQVYNPAVSAELADATTQDVTLRVIPAV